MTKNPSDKIPTELEKHQYEWSKFALGITYVYQQQDYRLTDAKFTLPTGFPPMGLDAVNSIENTADAFLLQFSYTPYPFITFFTNIGRINGEVDVSLVAPIGDINIGYEGWIYGGGIALSYAHKHYFATLVGAYTYADLDDAEINTFVVTPKIGIFNDRGALWIGAHYQYTEHSQTGTINLPQIGSISFNVDLEDDKNWNYLVGGRWNFTEDMSLTMEAGFADRKQLIISLEKKF